MCVCSDGGNMQRISDDGLQLDAQRLTSTDVFLCATIQHRLEKKGIAKTKLIQKECVRIGTTLNSQ